MASHSPPPSHHPPFSFRNLIKHAFSKLLPQFNQTNSANRFQIITSFIHAIAPSRRTLQHRTLPLYVIREFQSHPIPTTNRYTSFGEMSLNLAFQAAIGLIVSPQISPSRFLQIAEVMLVINFGVSFSGVSLRNSFPRFANILEKFGLVLTSFIFFLYLAIAGSVLPGRIIPGVILSDRTRLQYRCNGLLSLLVLVALLGVGVKMNYISPTAISDRGLELLSATFWFSVLATFLLCVAGYSSSSQSASLKPHITGNFIHDWWFGIQLNPHFLGIDLKFFFVRAGMMGWLLINLSVLARSVLNATLSQSMILYQTFCAIYVLDYFVHEEYMTSTWDIIAERLGFMLVFGDLVWIPFTFSIQGWWLLTNKAELTTAATIANCLVFLIGYLVFRGSNKQKHMFKKNNKALIWGKPPKVVGGKLLASGYWGIARHCNYLGDLLLALSFSLPCGISSPIPYFYPMYLLILLIWRERRDEARCAQKYKDIWAEYTKLVPWRILPYVY